MIISLASIPFLVLFFSAFLPSLSYSSNFSLSPDSSQSFYIQFPNSPLFNLVYSCFSRGLFTRFVDDVYYSLDVDFISRLRMGFVFLVYLLGICRYLELLVGALQEEGMWSCLGKDSKSIDSFLLILISNIISYCYPTNKPSSLELHINSPHFEEALLELGEC